MTGLELSDRQTVIGFDGSAGGMDALALGRELAEVTASRPLVAIVLRIPDHLMDRADLEAVMRVESQPLVALAEDRLAALSPETRVLIDDSPAHALRELVEAERPNLLVLGSARRGVIGRILLGSVGASLLSGAPCAIAVAPRGFAQRQGAELVRIGAAFDGSEEAWTALAAAASLAARLHGELTILAVAEPSSGIVVEALAEGEWRPSIERRLDDALAEARAAIPDGVATHRRLLIGEPAAALARAAEALDLLVVGSRGYGPIRRTLLGTTSERLMRTAPCPVLVIPRGAGEDPLGLGGVRLSRRGRAATDARTELSGAGRWGQAP